jgi:hypothetical protein
VAKVHKGCRGIDRLVARPYRVDNVINEDGTVGGKRVDKDNLRLGGNLFQFILHKSHIASPGIVPGP